MQISNQKFGVKGNNIYICRKIDYNIMSLITNPVKSTYPCYAFSDREMAVRKDGQTMRFDDLQLIADNCGATEWIEETAVQSASTEGDGVCALSIRDKSLLPEAYELIPVRTYFTQNAPEEILRTSRAKALLGWIRNAHYCGHCGTRMVPDPAMTAMTCPECHQLQFPRIEPCIITLVHRGDKILLARHAQRNSNIYACIAGFMEAGETAEHAVAREVYEETHLRVKNIRYFGSQSWPFPAQLMLGFTAEYESGEIKVQEDEIECAEWFDPQHCPASPPPGSIAYELIEDAKRRMQ